MENMSFKIPTSEVLHKTDRWLCNGHWVLSAWGQKLAGGVYKRAFNPVRNLAVGAYYDGYKKESRGKLPDIDAIAIPFQAMPDDRLELTNEIHWSGINTEKHIHSFNLKNERGKDVWISHKYIDLILLADEVYQQNELGLISLWACGEYIGGVMSTRR